MSDVAQPQRRASTSGACGLQRQRRRAAELCTTGTARQAENKCVLGVAAGVAGQKKIC